MAWRSTCGFQSESYRMTTSAVAKLIPSPPARVLNMKMNLELLGSLYALIEIWKQYEDKLTFYSTNLMFPGEKKNMVIRWHLLIQENSTAPVSPRVASVHPGDSSRSSSTYNSPPRCPAPWSSDWRWAHENLERTKNISGFTQFLDCLKQSIIWMYRQTTDGLQSILSDPSQVKDYKTLEYFLIIPLNT